MIYVAGIVGFVRLRVFVMIYKCKKLSPNLTISIITSMLIVYYLTNSIIFSMLLVNYLTISINIFDANSCLCLLIV